MDWSIKNLIGTFKSNKPSKDARSAYYNEQLQRISQDVAKWRRAVQRAEETYFPSRVELIQLYQDTILNGHVIACMDRRRNLTLLKDWSIYVGENEDEKTTEFLSKEWFLKAMKHALDAKFYGYTLLNWGDIVNGDITNMRSIRREYIDPEKRLITPIMSSPGGTSWESGELDKWTCFIPTDNETSATEVGLGLLYPVSYYEIMLRHLTGFNADYIELFGQPVRWGKTSKQGDARDEFEDGIANMGAKAYIVTDEMDELEFIQAGGNGGSQSFLSYDNFEQRLEKKISKILLGHSDALDSTPGKLGSQDSEESPVNRALNEIENIDNLFIERWANSIFLPKLRDLGLPIPIDAKLYFDNDKEEFKEKNQKNEQRKQIAEYVKNMSDSGYEFDEMELSEQMDMQIIKKEVQTNEL